MGRAIGGSAEKSRLIADAQGVDDADGHALAGFIEAEGSFGISANNGATTWRCSLAVAQRADDADMLIDIARVTGLGRLYARPARRKSRPQVCWAVSSKLECRELVRLLRRYPLRGRKRHEFAVWSAAVDRWSASLHGRGDPESHPFLRRSATEIRRLRRYVDQAALKGDDGSELVADRALEAYLGGFFTGEGSFGLRGSASAVIHLRADDAWLLHQLRNAFDIGSVCIERPPADSARAANPSVAWRVGRRDELARAIELFERIELRGRKRREFEAWRLGAAEYARGRARRKAIIAGAVASLANARAYVPRDLDLRSAGSPLATYADVLRAFAAELPDGPLTCTAYTRARRCHAEWPTRNTITLAFGSWAQALRKAGLAARLSARSTTVGTARSSATRTSADRPIAASMSDMGRSTAELASPPANEAQPLSADLGWLLSRASYTLTTELTAAFESLGLSTRANCVLATAMTGDHTQSEIARTVGLDKTTMVVTLDELEAAGLAERRPSPDDRRVRVIAVTAAGKRKVREAEAIAERIRDDVLSVLPEGDRDVFLKALTQLVSDRLAEPVLCSHPVRRRAPRA
jgi:DNA-binding MarR family transcriptional regulator